MIGCLTRKLTIEQAEAENLYPNPAAGADPIPFGFCNRQWNELLAQMRDGDELWEFTSSPASWDGRSGRAGLTLLRNGEEVAYVFTSMS